MMAIWYQFSWPLTSNQIYLVGSHPLNFCTSLLVIQMGFYCIGFIVLMLVLLDSEEAERIIQSKGLVFCLHDEPGVYRVWMPNGETPGLAVSRAFGDYCIKDFGLISVPHVTQRDITSKDQFVILATDGVCIRNNINYPYKLMSSLNWNLICFVVMGCHLKPRSCGNSFFNQGKRKIG